LQKQPVRHRPGDFFCNSKGAGSDLGNADQGDRLLRVT
jgi:hypothetical protein